MKSQEFCYWMQGLFELADPVELNAKQTDLIKRHLNMVFLHEIDPSYPAEQQAPLQQLHDGESGATTEITPPVRPFSGHPFGNEQVFLKC